MCANVTLAGKGVWLRRDAGVAEHSHRAHGLTPSVEQLATPEGSEVGVIPPDVLNRSPAELQRRYREAMPAGFAPG